MKIEDAIKQPVFKSPFEKVVVNIFYTANWLTYTEMHAFKQFDLSQQQYNILRILRGQYPEAATVNLLIERMLDKSSNASRIVEKLRAKGLVVRKVCKIDRRRVDVKITEKGLQILDEAGKILHDSRKKMEALTEDEALTLSDLLDKIRTYENQINNTIQNDEE